MAQFCATLYSCGIVAQKHRVLMACVEVMSMTPVAYVLRWLRLYSGKRKAMHVVCLSVRPIF